jgi:hexosaminidase
VVEQVTNFQSMRKTLTRFIRNCFLLAFFSQASAGASIHIIPEPVSIVELQGFFDFSVSTRIIWPGGGMQTTGEGILEKSVINIIGDFSKACITNSGKQPPILRPVRFDSGNNCILISIGNFPEIKNKEGYIIDIGRTQIRVFASAAAGLFYAFESIKQLLPANFHKMAGSHLSFHWKLPCAHILDYPQFLYRGMHLDVSRHFFSIDFIKKYIDILASYKINVFHWHLTDSHGWRVEIRQYPRLTSIGAWRADRKNIPMTIAAATGKNEPSTYGGFYTQEEIKQIVRYAGLRFVTVVPEIEMPGHCEAALVAYPQFACLNNKVPLLIPCGYQGDLTHNFCVGNDSTFIFLENILREVIQLFPSEYIHVGGDEVKPESWLTCPRCRKRMEEEGLNNGKQLQAWFTKRIDSFITASGKRMMGWEEIMDADISPKTAVMTWHLEEGGMRAVRNGRDVVMAPSQYTYFDFYQSDPGLEPDITYAKLLLDSVYAFNPMPAGLKMEEANHILGAEACLWTENILTPARIEYMLLPRLLALSESVWSPPQNKNYRRFIDKVEDAFKRFEAAKMNYASSMYNVWIQPEYEALNKTVVVTLNNQCADKYPVLFTTNGASPHARATIYRRPLVVRHTIYLKTALFANKRKLGKENSARFIIHRAFGVPVEVMPAGNREEQADRTRWVDGICGTVEPADGKWISFYDSLKTVTIDLTHPEILHSIAVGFMEDQIGSIYLPRKVEIFCSTNGIRFTKLYERFNKTIPQQKLRHIVRYRIDKLEVKAKYVRLTIHNASLSADSTKNGILADEIVVE